VTLYFRLGTVGSVRLTLWKLSRSTVFIVSGTTRLWERELLALCAIVTGFSLEGLLMARLAHALAKGSSKVELSDSQSDTRRREPGKI
jgi:hypothetical protein